MPWYISGTEQGCIGFAVVSEDDGEIVTCHKTKREAQDHLRALYASEPVEKAGKSYSPNDGMKSAARRALAWKEEGKSGGTIIGLTRANQIVNGTNLSESTVKRMYSFFSRHEVDKKATGFSAGEEGYPSPGRVAWDLWGGDAGFSWSRKIANSFNKKEEVQKSNDQLWLGTPFDLKGFLDK